MNTFKLDTVIHYGSNALERLTKIPYKKVLIITDPFIANGSMINLITEPLSRGGITYEIFHDVVADAPIEKIIIGVKVLLDYKPEGIIAVGGGSAIDSSKAIREFGMQVNPYGTVGLIAIPTTSGTGSEVTSFAVVNDTSAQSKYPLVSDKLTPDEAILDAELVKSVPPAVTADTGMDVFTHALEAYVSSSHNEFASALAEKAIEICGVFLLRAYLDGNDTHARQKMHVASCLAGIAFNSASLGLTHGMAHQLGAQFHIPHGRANAMLLPKIIEYNTEIYLGSKNKKVFPEVVKRYVTIAHMLGLSSYNETMSVRSLINWVEFMLKEMQIPKSISEMGRISVNDYMGKVEMMSQAALDDACTATNPKTPTKEEVTTIYRNLW
ncbi:MAG: 1-propanol dehydrogenase PduQ [Eubacteriales bacterium]